MAAIAYPDGRVRQCDCQRRWRRTRTACRGVRIVWHLGRNPGRIEQWLLAAANTLTTEDGATSVRLSLAAIADNVAAAQSRIYAYHADLDAAPNGGALHTQYFVSCPRASDTGVAEACTVVQWRDWSLRGQSGLLSMQVILYHSSFEIVLQYQSLDASLGSTATVGVQGPDAVSGLAGGCAGSRPLTAAMSVCLFDPRYPPGPAVIDLIFSDGFD